MVIIFDKYYSHQCISESGYSHQKCRVYAFHSFTPPHNKCDYVAVLRYSPQRYLCYRKYYFHCLCHLHIVSHNYIFVFEELQ